MEIVCDSRIRGEFTGFNDENVFILDNGQIWYQSVYRYKYIYLYRPRAQILNNNGIYYIKVEGMDEAIQVSPLYSYIETRIAGEFRGWKKDSVFKFVNGQQWKQAEYKYEYRYLNSPSALIYDAGSGYKLSIEGMTDNIRVKKI